MKPLLISSGEPAGIGPDLCLGLIDSNLPMVILGDQDVLENRAEKLKLNIKFKAYNKSKTLDSETGCLTVLHHPCPDKVVCGQLNPKNASYVIDLLTTSAERCVRGEFSALVTAPVHKAIINEANITFTGHTEFFAQWFNVPDVVMMLACEEMKVALVTTHLPLREVADAINSPLIVKVVKQLVLSLDRDFLITNPTIKIAGLNPHAGESGYLGREELDCIIPALEQLREEGIHIIGPLPADTMFTKDSENKCDAYVTMYHDQGLPVLKYVGFNHSVNITLGLPIIRTSVDHGTALDLAGRGIAHSGSLLAAVNMAHKIAQNRTRKCHL